MTVYCKLVMLLLCEQLSAGPSRKDGGRNGGEKEERRLKKVTSFFVVSLFWELIKFYLQCMLCSIENYLYQFSYLRLSDS